MFFLVFPRLEITNSLCFCNLQVARLAGTKGAFFAVKKNCCFFVFPLWMVFMGDEVFFLLNEVNQDQASSFRQEPIHVEDATFFFFLHFFKVEKAPK